MKKALSLTLFICFISFMNTGLLKAQNKPVPVPDISWKVYFFDEKENEAVDMETGDLEYKKRTRGYGGIGTQEGIWQIAGEKSVVRINKKEKLNFLLKLNNENYDINKEYMLVKLAYNPKTKARELVTMKVSSWSDKAEENYETVHYTNTKVTVKKQEDGTTDYVIRMLTVENLPPGEYVWMRGWSGTNSLFFGVNP